MIKIYINNNEFSLETESTIVAALKMANISRQNGIAIALNGDIVAQPKWNEILLQDGDKLIVIGAVAGG